MMVTVYDFNCGLMCRPYEPRRRHAVVVGGSLAGMLAARVLSDHYDDVTLLERDRYPGGPGPRRGLPHGRHAHALLDRGRGVLESLFPGLGGELVRAGASPMDATRDFARLGPYGWYARPPGRLLSLASGRDLLDRVVRGRVAAIPNVGIHQGADVVGLIRSPRGGHDVAGVRLRARSAPRDDDGGDDGDDRAAAKLAADLVVVADGRHSRLPEWLAALGHEAPRETVVDSRQGYASRTYRPPSGFRADWKALYIQQAPPAHPRGGLIFPVEGGNWIVSLVGGDGHYPPTDEAGFLEFARGLRSPALYEAIASAEPLTPIAGQRGTENRLRQYDRLRRLPEGVLAVGDAVAAFNPVYGQGMTAAAIGAEVLDRWLRGESSRLGSGRGLAFQRALARATAVTWRLSTGADYRFRTTAAPPRGLGERLAGRYLDGVLRASTTDPWVCLRMSEVFHLVRPPSSLFAPSVLARVAWDRFAGEDARGDVPPPPRGMPDAGPRPARSSAPHDLDPVASGAG